MNITVKNRFRHSCDLEEDTRILEAHVHYNTKFQKVRKLLRNARTLSEGEDTRRYFRSNSEFTKEKRRHLAHYYFMNHPFSIITRSQSLLLSLLWLLAIFLESFFGTFLAEQFYARQLPLLEGLLYVINLVFFCDVMLRLTTGYAIEKTRTVIMDRKLSMKHYLKTYFFFDALPCLGYIGFYHTAGFNEWIGIFLFQLHKLRYVRIKTILQNMDKSLMYLRVEETIRKFLQITLIGILCVHFLTCISGLHILIHKKFGIPYGRHSWYQMAKEHRFQYVVAKNSDFNHYEYIFFLYALHCGIVSCHFFGLYSSRFHNLDVDEMFFLTFVMLLGMSFYIYCIARILQLVGILHMSDAKFDELLISAEEYMRKKKFSPELKARIAIYYDYKFNKKYFNEASILGSLSEHLQMEVLLYSCKNLINRVSIFKGLSKSAVGCLLSLMKQDIFVPNDEILHARENTTSIYFILHGTCGIELFSGKEVMHIEDGDHFGHLVGFAYDPSSKLVFSVVALEMVETYRLDQQDMMYCVKNFPEIQARLEIMEKSRLKRFNHVFSIRGDEEDVTEDIVDQLRRGRIISHGIRRSDFA